MDDFARLYVRDDAQFEALHRARCRCGAIRYEVSAEPVNAKICHCAHCQRRHGAPMQWAAIFQKRDIRLTAGLDLLRFYSSETDTPERVLPLQDRLRPLRNPRRGRGTANVACLPLAV